MQNCKEVNVWSSTVYSCDFHEGRQHFITSLMFVSNFVLFFNLFTLVIFMKVFHHIVDACVEFCFLKKQLDHKYATIILYYYCDQPSSFSQAPSACGVQCSTERLVCFVFCRFLLEKNNFYKHCVNITFIM